MVFHKKYIYLIVQVSVLYVIMPLICHSLFFYMELFIAADTIYKAFVYNLYPCCGPKL